VVGIGPGGRPMLQDRWTNGVHPFTWESKLLAIQPNRNPVDDRLAK
jgi:hypothetical protein